MTPQNFIGRLRRSEDGVAAIEMSLVAGMFCFGILNVAELSRYAFSSMEDATATQMGVAAALAACDVAHLPATVNCAGLNTAVTTALQGTSLGSNVTLSGQITEGYYCVSGTGVLTSVGGPTSPPADCSAASNASGKPALYLQLSTSYTYTPLFGGVTVVGALPHQMTRTAWTRMQ
jgi:Flp pilus assembly protein TadG